MSPTPSDADKAALRRSLRAKRRALSAPQRIEAALAMAAHLRSLPAFDPAARIAGYWAVGGEMPLLGLFAPPRPSAYHLPCLGEDGVLHFAAWSPGQILAPNSHGIPEPLAEAPRLAAAELDLVVLPLLGFTRAGHRLGQGGGWYDRSLAFLRQQPRPARPLLVGAAFALQEVPEFAHEPWDVPLDYVATERELIPCAAHRAEAAAYR
jgi:5-formyltetrahydrofolate cyclo-ligase